MGKQKVVVHSLLVEEPDIEMNVLDPEVFDVIHIANENVELFYKESQDADGLIIADRKIDKDFINQLEKCKIIARQGIGVDSIDLNAAKEKGIAVTNVPDYCIEEVSNFTLALLFSITKNIGLYDKHVKKGIWDIESPENINKMPKPRRFNTQTLGILSFGKIARSVAEKAKPFGFNIIVNDPYVSEDVAKKYGIQLVEFDELLKESDILCINAPLTPETKHLFDLEAFKKMKETAFLINTSRGPLIKEEDLYRALKDRLIAGAAVDVLEEEPPAKDNPLLSLDNIIITPHAAFYTADSYEEMRVKAATEVKRVLSGEEPNYWTNK